MSKEKVKTRNRVLNYGVAGVVIISLCSFALYKTNTNRPSEITESSIGNNAFSDKFLNISLDNKVSIRYQDIATKTLSEDVKTLDSKGSLTVSANDNVISRDSNVYDVSYSFTLADNEVSDVILSVDKTTNTINSNLKNLPVNSRVTLFYSAGMLEKSVNVDWAGNIRFTHGLQNFKDDKTFCVMIQNNSISRLCHTIPMARRAS